MPIMTLEEHKARHVELHRALDELLADYISHHPTDSFFLQMPINNLLRWSYEQTKNPTPDK